MSVLPLFGFIYLYLPLATFSRLERLDGEVDGGAADRGELFAWAEGPVAWPRGSGAAGGVRPPDRAKAGLPCCGLNRPFMGGSLAPGAPGTKPTVGF